MRSGSKTGAFITSATEKLRGHTRTPSNQSDTSEPAAMHEMHATIGSSMSETDHATWEGETGDLVSKVLRFYLLNCLTFLWRIFIRHRNPFIIFFADWQGI